MSQQWGKILLMILGLTVATVLPAQTEQKPEPEKSAEPQQEEPPRETPDSEETERQPAPEFKPSEEISEDLSVPFPVDI